MVANLVNLKINSERLKADFDTLAEIGATMNGGVSRLALSNEDLEARAWLANQFEDAGLLVKDDDAGNLSGILPCSNPKAKTLLLGGHMDSVPNGGRFDGSLGILGSLECMRTLKEGGVTLPVHLEAINFTDEEGCWQSLFGSRALTGKLNTVYSNDQSADDGPFRAALFRAGIRPNDVHKAKRSPKSIAGYLELHIEQGYRLDELGLDIGVVTGIVGRTTYLLTFHGEAGHSGTTANAKRRNALQGASDYIVSAFDVTRNQFPKGVFNCGNLEVLPGKFNIIPSEARMTMECRHPDETRLLEMESALIRLAQEKAAQLHLTVNIKRIIHMPAASMAPDAIDAIEETCDDLQVSHTQLISYAGHDAQMLSGFTTSGMIFVPSVGGISHSPKEFTEWHHIEKGTNVLLHTILRLAQWWE